MSNPMHDPTENIEQNVEEIYKIIHNDLRLHIEDLDCYNCIH